MNSNKKASTKLPSFPKGLSFDNEDGWTMVDMEQVLAKYQPAGDALYAKKGDDHPEIKKWKSLLVRIGSAVTAYKNTEGSQTRLDAKLWYSLAVNIRNCRDIPISHKQPIMNLGMVCVHCGGSHHINECTMRQRKQVMRQIISVSSSTAPVTTRPMTVPVIDDATAFPTLQTTVPTTNGTKKWGATPNVQESQQGSLTGRLTPQQTAQVLGLGVASVEDERRQAFERAQQVVEKLRESLSQITVVEPVVVEVSEPEKPQKKTKTPRRVTFVDTAGWTHEEPTTPTVAKVTTQLPSQKVLHRDAKKAVRRGDFRILAEFVSSDDSESDGEAEPVTIPERVNESPTYSPIRRRFNWADDVDDTLPIDTIVN